MTKEKPTKTTRPARTERVRRTPQPAARPRVVVTESVTHVSPKGAPPQNVTVGHARFLASDEAPYLHPGASFRVGGEWVALPLGWLEDPAGGPPNVSEVVLENIEGRDQDHIPTPEEAEALARRVLEVGFTSARGPGDMWDPPGGAAPDRPELLVPPGDLLRVKPVDARTVRVRSADPRQSVRVNVLLLPR